MALTVSSPFREDEERQRKQVQALLRAESGASGGLMDALSSMEKLGRADRAEAKANEAQAASIRFREGDAKRADENLALNKSTTASTLRFNDQKMKDAERENATRATTDFVSQARAMGAPPQLIENNDPAAAAELASQKEGERARGVDEETKRMRAVAAASEDTANAERLRRPPVAKAPKGPDYKIPDALRDDFEKLKEVKEYKEATALRASMDNFAKQRTPQSDRALTVTAVKILDPTSVVSQNEINSAAIPRDVLGRLSQALGTASTGNLLDDGVRAGFIQMADGKIAASKALFDDAMRRYTDLAKARSVDPAQLGIGASVPSDAGGGVGDLTDEQLHAIVNGSK